VDNSIYTDRPRRIDTSVARLADLATQVQHWINFENQKCLNAERCQRPEANIFTVFVGFWDLWEYIEADRAVAEDAITQSVNELFTQLDVIMEHAPHTPRVVLPKMFDLGFMPGFRTQRMGYDTPSLAEQQHSMAYLVSYWNMALEQKATEWVGGDIYMPKWSQWFLDQVHTRQLDGIGYHVAGAASRFPSMFDEVESPCLWSSASAPDDLRRGSTVNEIGVSYCTDPASHLFWCVTYLFRSDVS